MKKAAYSSIVAVKSFKLDKACKEWLDKQEAGNGNTALRKLILAEINTHENGAKPIQTGYSNENGLEEHKKYSPKEIQCSGCSKPGLPLLFVGNTRLCLSCGNQLHAFLGCFG